MQITYLEPHIHQWVAAKSILKNGRSKEIDKKIISIKILNLFQELFNE